MNSTDFNKIAGAGLGALLIFLLLNFFSGQIYGTSEVGHAEGEEVLAFALPIEEAGGGEAEEAPQVDLAALFTEADASAGEKVFRACSACHAVEAGVNKVGPSLHGVVGRPVASIADFSYSDAMAAHGGDWTPEEMFHFLENPKAWVPGTKMSYAGLGDPADRANVIAYLNQQGDAPVDLTAGIAPLAEATAAGAAESSVSEGQNAGGVVTGVTTVDTSEGADAPTSPAAESAAAAADQPSGETVLHSPDPSQEAPAQQNTAGEVGLPGQGAAPQSGAPLPGGVSEAPPAPSSTDVPPGTEPPVTQTPVIRREGEQAEQGGVPVGPAQEPVEPQAQGQQGASQQQAPAPAQGEQMAAAPAAPAGGASGGGGVDFASADVAAGEKLFRRCAACHKLEEGKNAVGPSLWGVVGRPVASIEGFSYSDAMKAHGGQWTPENLFQYLENPKGMVPGTKMAFAGLKDPQDRIDVIAYLNEHGGDPQALQQ